MAEQLQFIDLFAGIGGFRLGMERAGHKCVGWVESDPKCEKCKKITKHYRSEKRNYTICSVCGKEKRQHARFSYEAIHNTEGEWTEYDITEVTDEQWGEFRGKVDVICGGFPCQAFSVAGKRRGFEDTRGTLFFEIARAAKQIKPRYLFLENVKGLLSHEKGETFAAILSTLDELGYDAEWQLLNSKDFRVPQNRERVFIIGHLRGSGRREVFPIERTSGSTVIADVIGLDDQGRTSKQLKPLDVWPTLRRETHGNEPKVVVVGNTNPSGNGMNGNVFSSEGLAPTLTTNKGEGNKIVVPVLTPDRAEKRQNGRRFKEDGEPMFTLTAQDKHGVLIENNTVIQKTHGATTTIKQNETGTLQAARLDKVPMVVKFQRIRKLTPRECWRLQSFPDWAFDKASEVNSDSQLYKQAGNSVTVNVIYRIARALG